MDALGAAHQIEGLDPGVVDLERAEWVGSELHLRLVVVAPDASRHLTFRIVGVEPRMWDVSAPSGSALDVTAGGVVVRMPAVTTDLVLTPGSY